MNILKFHTNQTDLANTIKYVIDSYLNNEISNEEMIENVNELINLNTDKYYKADTKDIATRIKLILGIKRLSLIDKVLKQVEK